jgi:hypothetical protein
MGLTSMVSFAQRINNWNRLQAASAFALILFCAVGLHFSVFEHATNYTTAQCDGTYTTTFPTDPIVATSALFWTPTRIIEDEAHPSPCEPTPTASVSGFYSRHRIPESVAIALGFVAPYLLIALAGFLACRTFIAPGAASLFVIGLFGGWSLHTPVDAGRAIAHSDRNPGFFLFELGNVAVDATFLIAGVWLIVRTYKSPQRIGSGPTLRNAGLTVLGLIMGVFLPNAITLVTDIYYDLTTHFEGGSAVYEWTLF